MRHPALALATATLASGLLAATTLAQTASPCGLNGGGGPSIYSTYAKTNPPFSATIQTTHDQKLADGNAIHGEIVTHVYRDSSGRTRTETPLSCIMGLDGQFRPIINVTINDPANHTTMTWQVDGRDKVARVIHQEVFGPQPTVPPGAVVRSAQEERTLSALMQQYRAKNTRTEKLPDADIAGFACEHTRMTTTIPAGEKGNEQPMESIDELCIARGVGLTMLRVSDSPLSGRTEARVTEFSPLEPAPSLFAPPPGYIIEDQSVRAASAASPQ